MWDATASRTYETPLILARADDGFVAELTYGADVAWYRNLLANKTGELLVRGSKYRVTGIEPYPAAAARGVPGRRAHDPEIATP